MTALARRVVFGLFFVSGFSCLAYQMVWTRLAFAAFGIITPVLSVVLSVFMLGLAVGSWAGGRVIGRLTSAAGASPLVFYAAAEGGIGVGAFAVPSLLGLASRLLLTSGQTNSTTYFFLSAVALAAALLPWCVAMGATFPFMMAFVRERGDAGGSFSFLYVANVLGAIAGTFLTAMVFIELLGFRRTLWVAGAGNFTIAVASLWLARQRPVESSKPAASSSKDSRAAAKGAAPARRRSGHAPVADRRPPGAFIKSVLFVTGFVAMASEVVWTRDFTPVLKTQVYSFALIVLTYLAATLAGSLWYRRARRRQTVMSVAQLIGALLVTIYLPVLANDPRLVNSDWVYTIDLKSALIVLASICPVCLVLGYLTPRLIDDDTGGDPAAAGRAYAVNVLGCIAGPLVASYALLPWMPARYALLVLGAPLWVLFFLDKSAPPLGKRLGAVAAAGVVLAIALFASEDFEGLIASRASKFEVRRDYAASVVSAELGNSKTLLVNGIGMTVLSPVTKVMVHLPLALRRDPPKSVLVICFGMGTTFRAAMSWGIDTTAVELVPGVTQAFEFYHADAAEVRANPHGRIVVDDGRRFLMRTRDKFDLIVVDPPPPPEAAGSSLLFSQEFTELARQHLNPGGMLQTWFIGQEVLVFQALLRSVSNVFPHVRTFGSIEGWGIHLVASADPIDAAAPEQMAGRMPPAAQRDLMEWAPPGPVASYLASILAREIPVEKSLNPDPTVRITDDRPLNEYFLLRHYAH